MKVPSGSLNDDSWHTVVVKRRGKSVQVSVDNLAQGKNLAQDKNLAWVKLQTCENYPRITE